MRSKCALVTLRQDVAGWPYPRTGQGEWSRCGMGGTRRMEWLDKRRQIADAVHIWRLRSASVSSNTNTFYTSCGILTRINLLENSYSNRRCLRITKHRPPGCHPSAAWACRNRLPSARATLKCLGTSRGRDDDKEAHRSTQSRLQIGTRAWRTF